MSRERNAVRAGVLALLVHGAFFLLLVFGVSWQSEHAAPVMVDLWQALPQPSPSVHKAKPAPAHKPVVKESPAPVKNPDIALEKKKRESQRKKEEQAEHETLDKARRAEAEKLKKQHETQRKIEEDELQRRIMEEELTSETRRVQQMVARAASARRASAMAGVIAEYQAKISAKIRGNTRLPENLQDNPQVKFRVKLLPTGEVLDVNILQRSGNTAYDAAVERAIRISSPLPLPEEKDARSAFVPEVTLAHRARE